MRVLHVVHTPRYSGAETLVASLASIHEAAGHRSRVVALTPAEDDFRVLLEQQRLEGIEWIYPGERLPRSGRVAWLRNGIKDFRPDVVIAHSIIPALYARLTGFGRVFSVLHSADEDDYASARFRFAEYLLQFRSAGVISVSELARQRYSRRFRFPQTRHIPNGIDLDRFASNSLGRGKLRLELGLGSDALVAVQIGRINSIKQQHKSLEALLPIISAASDVHLVFAGLVEDEGYLLGLRSLVAAAGVEARVHFLGPRSDVDSILRDADVYLMPSEREAHSVAMIEALASGLPIVASSIASFQYAKAFDGVHLIDHADTVVFGQSIAEELRHRRRYKRSLGGLDIRQTASAYLEFAA